MLRLLGQTAARRFRRPLLSSLTHPFATTANEKNAEALATLVELLELPNVQTVHQVLGAHSKHILVEQPDDIRQSFEQLLKLNYTVADIRLQPKVLAKNSLTIRNHHQALHEINFRPVDIAAINRFISILNKTPDELAELRLIDAPQKLAQRLANYMHIELDARRTYSTDRSVKDLRREVFNTFLDRYLGIRTDDQKRIWATYANLRNKSLRSIREAVQLCESAIGMDKERIRQHAYVLYADPDNIRQIMAVGKLNGIDTRELLWRRPKIMMTHLQRLLRTQQVIRDFGVPDAAVSRCIEIYTLAPDTIHERLHDMHKIREFDVLVTHPRVLRLVHYQIKARARLEYLRKMKVNCVSLHVLSSGAHAFERYARTGIDRTKGQDILTVLHQRFGLPQLTIRRTMNRHPNWCHVPVVSVKQVLDWLTERGFDDRCIYANVHIMLYPLKRIEQKFAMLDESQERWGIARADITPMQQLQMILYLIELEFHFEGDGVWLDELLDGGAPPPMVGETEYEMLGDYRKTIGPIRWQMESDGAETTPLLDGAQLPAAATAIET